MIQKWIPRQVALFFGLLSAGHFLLYKLGIHLPLTPDQSLYTYNYLSFLKQGMASGAVPYWAPHFFSGLPLLFLGSIDLKNLPFLWVMTPLDVMFLQASAYIFFGGLSFFIFARHLYKFGESISVLGGLFWLTSGFFLCYYYDHTVSVCYFWIPLFVFILTRDTLTPFAKVSLLTLGMIDQVMSGRHDSVEMALMTTGVLLLLRIFLEDNGTPSQMRRRIFVHVGCLLAALCIAVLVCFPFLEQQTRIIAESARAGGRSGSLIFPTAILNFFPLVPESKTFLGFTPGISDAYLGFANVFFVIAGLVASKRRVKNRYYVGLAAFFFLFLYDLRFFGVHLFHDLYKSLPKHGGVIYPQRFIPLIFALLSIPLMDGITQALGTASKRLDRIQLACGLIPLSLAAFLLFRDGRGVLETPNELLLLVLLGSTGTSLLALLRLRSSRRAATGLLVGLTILAGVLDHRIILSHGPPDPYHYFDYVQRHPERSRYMRLLGQGAPAYSYRIADCTPEYEAHDLALSQKGFHVLSGYYTLLDVEMIQFIESVLGGTYDNKIHLTKVVDLRAFDLANVRYFVTCKNCNLCGREKGLFESGKLVRQFSSDSLGIDLYESRTYLPRAFFAPDYEILPKDEILAAINARLKSRPDWFKKGVFITADSNRVPYTGALSSGVRSNTGTATVEIVRYSSETVELSVESAIPGVVVLLDHFDRQNWDLFVDGKRTSYSRANHAYRGAFVTAGKHTLEYRYSVPRWTWLLCGLGMLALLGTIIAAYRYRR